MIGYSHHLGDMQGGPRLTAAKRNVHFLTFSYTADTISDAMVAKLKAGLVVRGVFERQNAGGSGADFNRLKQGGVDVLEDGNCYILHHKVIVIDERTVITGSYNFTGSAEHDNDENLVIVDDPATFRSCSVPRFSMPLPSFALPF